MVEVTKHVAEFAASLTLRDIPDEVVEIGRGHMLDSLGLMLAGSIAEGTRIARDYIAGLGCTNGSASVFGSDMRTTPRFAAFVNGCAVHADDYDDTTPQPLASRNGGVHASGGTLAAILATAEAEGRSGRDVTEAFYVGVEIASRLGHAIAARHYESGYHATGTMNGFGAAAAVGRLLGLDVPRLRMALGIAGSQAGGLRENFGTMTKPFHVGHAAECGTVAAELAANGFTAAQTILEAPRGFFSAAGGGYDEAFIDNRLGNPWAFQDPGVWIKPYPCGALTHPAMTLLEDWIGEHKLKADQVERVKVQTNEKLTKVLLHHQPKTGLQGKFSMQFCLAILLLRGKAGLAEFTDEVVNDPQVQEMIGRVAYVPLDEVKPDYANVTTFLEIRLKDGRTISGRVDYAKGNPKRRMDFEAIAAKFRDCAAYAGWPKDKAEAIVEKMRSPQDIGDIRELTRLLVRG